MSHIERAPSRMVARGRTRTTLGAAVVAMLMVALAAACAPPTPTPNPYGLRATLGDGEIVLEWRAPDDAPVDAYDVQWWDDASTQWHALPSTAGTTTAFTAVENRTRYSFRVRALTQGGTARGEWSPAVVAWYVDLVLPILRVDTNGAAPILDRENYVPGTVTLEPNGSAFLPYSGTMGIRGRGNSTWTYSKKPYKLKLDTKSALMGLGAERDWALLANAVDESQLRTYAAMQASAMTDLPYTPAVRHIEVVLNGQYQGVYVLTEHQEIGGDRVDITEMDDTDNEGEALTGGYRLEIDDRLEENAEPGFRTPQGVPVVVKDPDPATPQQRNYIRNLVNAFESSLYAPNSTDPVNGYRKHLDVDSFIDHYLVQELTRNQDVFWSSTFFTKERGEDRFRFGPVWDFDRSMGTELGSVPAPPDGFRARGRGPWSRQIFKDPTFVDAVAERWNELRTSFALIGDLVEAEGAQLRPAIENDLVRWHFPVNPGLHPTDTPEFLSGWLAARIAWLDTQYPDPTP